MLSKFGILLIAGSTSSLLARLERTPHPISPRVERKIALNSVALSHLLAMSEEVVRVNYTGRRWHFFYWDFCFTNIDS
jgi:hypothetical protein